MRKAKIIFVFILALLIAFVSPNLVKAENGTRYYTYTLDENNNLIRTQDAYIAVKLVSTFNIGTESYTVKAPEDIYHEETNDLFYIADTGNGRIIVCDNNFKNAKIIGEGILKTPQGVFANSQGDIYVSDYDLKKVVIFDKAGNVIQEVGKPDHPLYGESVEFKPTKIMVDKVGTMYVIDAGNANGVVTISKDGSFSGYFGANYTTPDLKYIIKFMFSTKEQRMNLYRSPIAPTNLAFDYDGLLYTVTNGLDKATVKKLNIAGNNMFSDDIYGTSNPLDVCIGPTGTIYTIDKNGYIVEYDKEGNMLFDFAGKDTTGKYLGLFNDPKSIEVDSNYRLYVLDKSGIQIFIPTEFSGLVHEALNLYNDGKYEESREPWEKVLQMNNMFNLAHRGLGNSYLREQNYEKALYEFELAKDVTGYSNAYWEVRNDYLMKNATVFIIVIFIICLTYYILNKLHVLDPIKEAISNVFKKARKVKLIDEFLYLFTFIRHPLNGFYEIQRQNKMGVLAATIWYVIFFIIIVLSNIIPGFIFNTTSIETISLINFMYLILLRKLLVMYLRKQEK